MMKTYRKKIENRNLTSDDIGSIILKIELIIKEKLEGHAELSNDDIKQLKILQFLLKKYEENDKNVDFSTQSEHLRHHKVRHIINEFLLNQIITKPLTGLGGVYSFEILDKIRYRNHIYGLVELVLDKIPQNTLFGYFDFNKINWSNPYLRGILVGVLVGVILLIIVALVPSSSQNNDVVQPPRVDIESVSFFPSTFTCNRYSDFKITYKVAHISGKKVGFGQPYYIFVNQTENTCLDNFTFFNNTSPAQGLCHNTFYKSGEKIEACTPKFEPIFEETIKVESDLNSPVYRMIDLFKNKSISDCKISEQVKICVDLDDLEYCSDIKTVDIEYIGCKGPDPFLMNF